MTSSLSTFPAKRLLLPLRAGEDVFFQADYTMNLYRGCNHGCIYCDTRSECYQIDRFDEIRVKENCLLMLEKELRQKKKAGTVFMGATSDPYNAAEEDECITRTALQLLQRYGFGVGLTTKSALVARDAEVLAEIARKAPAFVSFSITSAQDDFAGLVEPGAAPSSKRFSAMRVLADAGVLTGMWLNPMIPFLTDNKENMLDLLEKTAASGGRYAICHFGMTLRTGNREYFYAALDAQPRFTGVKQQYVHTFGQQYHCPSSRAKELWELYQIHCQKLGLLFRFADVNSAARAYCPKQLSF